MLMIIIIAILQGLLYAVLSMGVYTSFRILNKPDLTVDGSFSLGMACAAVFTLQGHPILALFVAMIAGAAAGFVTGLLQTKIGIHPILSGILVMTGLYSVNLGIMGGKSNLSIAGKPTLMTKIEELIVTKHSIGKVVLALVICALVLITLSLFFKTRLGLAIRATGDNEEMVRSSSINANMTKCIGLSIANAFVGLSGALICQQQMVSDVGFGSGMVVMGLASVIIGEAVFGRRSITRGFTSAIVGMVIYRIIIAIALRYNMFPNYALKLVSSIIVAIALAVPVITANIKQYRVRREVKSYAKTSKHS